MDYLCVMILGFAALFIAFVLLCKAIVEKHKRRKSKFKEEQALNGIAAGICAQLHSVYPDSKWRWVCRPAGFAVNGGISRIDVICVNGARRFVDVCLSPSGYMALHEANVTELTASGAVSASPQAAIPTPAPRTGSTPNDEESVLKWYNIVFYDALTGLIENLNASGEICLQIGADGKAFVEERGNIVYDFGEMPDVTLWDFITEKLGEAGLFAEVREGNCIFVSWA